MAMQYANNGSLLSYLHHNISKLTWKMKFTLLKDIARLMHCVHYNELMHCDLHCGNIVFHDDGETVKPFICDLGLSKTENANSKTVYGVLPYVAPEVLHARKFTRKSDVYSFGILMILIASGEPPFRDKVFELSLALEICQGLRPAMPESAPEEYKEIAEWCCNGDPNKRPSAFELHNRMIAFSKTLDKGNSDGNEWNTIYNAKKMKPLSRVEKEHKYSSKLLPTTADIPSMEITYDMSSIQGRNEIV